MCNRSTKRESTAAIDRKGSMQTGLAIEKQLLHLHGACRRDCLRADQLLPHVLQLLLLLHMAGCLLAPLGQDPGQSLVLLLSLLQLLLQLHRCLAGSLQSTCSHAFDMSSTGIVQTQEAICVHIGICRYCANSQGSMYTHLQDYTCTSGCCCSSQLKCTR